MKKHTKKTDPTILLIAGHVKALREKSGLTQSDLADLYGCRQPYISQIERGDRGYGFKTLNRLAQILGVKVEELWAENPDDPESLNVATA